MRALAPAALLLLAPAAAAQEAHPVAIESEAQLREELVGRRLSNEDADFSIGADGGIGGTYLGSEFVGEWD